MLWVQGDNVRCDNIVWVSTLWILRVLHNAFFITDLSSSIWSRVIYSALTLFYVICSWGFSLHFISLPFSLVRLLLSFGIPPGGSFIPRSNPFGSLFPVNTIRHSCPFNCFVLFTDLFHSSSSILQCSANSISLIASLALLMHWIAFQYPTPSATNTYRLGLPWVPCCLHKLYRPLQLLRILFRSNTHNKGQNKQSIGDDRIKQIINHYTTTI